MGSSLDLLNLLYLVVVEPLLPLLAGAGLFMLTRSHLIAAGLSALGFGAWGALYFSRLSLNGPLSGALSGLEVDGVTSGLVALAGSGYLHLIGSEARCLGTERTAIVHAVGIAFAAIAFVLLLVTHGSDKVGIWLYLVLLAWSLGAAAATGSFGGANAEPKHTPSRPCPRGHHGPLVWQPDSKHLPTRSDSVIPRCRFNERERHLKPRALSFRDSACVV